MSSKKQVYDTLKRCKGGVHDQSNKVKRNAINRLLSSAVESGDEDELYNVEVSARSIKKTKIK